MNVFKKSIVYSAVGLIVIGLTAIIIGAAFGGTVRNFRFGDTTDISEDYTDIKSINVEHSAGTLYIKTGDSFKIEGRDVFKDYFKSEVKDGVWYISDSSERAGWFGSNFQINFGRWRTTHSTVTIYIPEGFILDDSEIKLGAGKIEVDELNTENFTIKVGAGDVTINKLSAETANIECGVGSIKINGEILGDSKIEAGVGSISLNLSGLYTDYNYKVKVGLGSASINDNKYDGTTDTSITNPDSKATFDIEVGLGEVSIEIEE